MKVFQIGAAGGVGRRLAALLVADGHEVTGMVRKPDQAGTVTESGAQVVGGDLIENSVEQLADLIAGHDAVVFSAGAHGTGRDQTTLIDGVGLEKAAAAAQQAGANRFLLVSVFPDAGRAGDPQEGFEHYMRVKKSADVYLVSTSLDWVVVRPGTLLDEPGDGRVTAGLAIEYGDVSRDNVAAFLAAVLVDRAVSREIIELTDGSTPASEAVTALRR